MHDGTEVSYKVGEVVYLHIPGIWEAGAGRP